MVDNRYFDGFSSRGVYFDRTLKLGNSKASSEP